MRVCRLKDQARRRARHKLGRRLVMTVPALRALRRVLPQAKITLVIRPGTKGIFAEADFIDDYSSTTERDRFLFSRRFESGNEEI